MAERSEEGSFTLEASIVVPLVFLVSLAGLFFLLSVFAQVKAESDVLFAEAGNTHDPDESIRLVGLMRHYIPLLMEKFIGSEQASQYIRAFHELNGQVAFARHDDAASYLRELVGGREQKLFTPHGDRILDAVTAEGIAHHAYLTFTEKQLREAQMPKDSWLLRHSGEVNGAVWHFFRRTGQEGRVGPSQKLIADLQEHGIMVVIHD